MGHSYGTLLWDTLVGHSCGSLLLDTLVGPLSWDTLSGHPCRKLLQDTLVGHSCCGTLLRDSCGALFLGHSCGTLLSLTSDLPCLPFKNMCGHKCSQGVENKCLRRCKTMETQRYGKLLSRTCRNNRNSCYFSPGDQKFCRQNGPRFGVPKMEATHSVSI